MPPRARALVLAAALLAARPDGGAAQLTRFPWASLPDSAGLGVVPLTLHTAFRSGWTDDRDNGALWAGKGLSALVRGGVAWRRGPLRVVLAPEMTWASNGGFVLADAPRPSRGRVFSGYSTPWLPMDLVRRWGDGSAGQIHLGQSVAELRWGGVAVGASSANLVRGPEVRHPVVVGVSGPGVPSGFVEARGRAGPLGRLGVRVQCGVLAESPFFDDDPDNDRLLLSTFFADWEPAFLPGLSLGGSYTYRDPMDGGFTLSMLGKAFSTASAQTSEEMAEDGLAAFHGRWETGPAAVWGSWGRSDYWLNTADLLTDPEHTQFWTAGAQVAWWAGGNGWQVVAEALSSAGRAARMNDPYRTGGTHRHRSAQQGHTHQGQMLGPSVGPGANAQWVRVVRTDTLGGSWGVEVERILRDLDAYSEALRRADGASGEDREWRLAGLYEGSLPGFTGRLAGVRGLTVLANGGLSLRWNRDYVRYSANADRVGPRETQIFLDLVLRWDPRAR